MKVLPPIIHRDEYNRLIEPELMAYLDEVLFGPLNAELENLELPFRVNSTDPLLTAIESGAVWYHDGEFRGAFSARTSKALRDLGAVFTSGGGFKIEITRLPLAVRSTLAAARVRDEEVHKGIILTLDRMEQGVLESPAGLKFTKAVDAIAKNLQKQFVETVESSTDDITVQPDTSPEVLKQLDDQLTHSATLAIRGFTAEQIVRLRQRVQANFLSGGRASQLRDLIQTEGGVARRHANFIAEQETSLIVAKYREVTYAKIGIDSYEWSCVPDHKVRPDHRALNGRRFRFSDPPICDRATGKRANPGEDYGCRCTALPVLT